MGFEQKNKSAPLKKTQGMPLAQFGQTRSDPATQNYRDSLAGVCQLPAVSTAGQSTAVSKDRVRRLHARKSGNGCGCGCACGLRVGIGGKNPPCGTHRQVSEK